MCLYFEFEFILQGNVENVRTFKLMDPVASTKRSVDSETQTSPLTPRRSHHHHHHHHHKYVHLYFSFIKKIM